jgi:hypothetical protein
VTILTADCRPPIQQVRLRSQIMEDAIDSRLPPGYISFSRQSLWWKFASGAEAPVGLKASVSGRARPLRRSLEDPLNPSVAGYPIRLYGDPLWLRLRRQMEGRFPTLGRDPGSGNLAYLVSVRGRERALPRQTFPDEQEGAGQWASEDPRSHSPPLA